MLSLPDQLVDLLDEWGEAREEEADDAQQKNCHQRFPHFILSEFDVNRAMTFMNILIYLCIAGIQIAREHPLLLSYITTPQCSCSVAYSVYCQCGKVYRKQRMMKTSNRLFVHRVFPQWLCTGKLKSKLEKQYQLLKSNGIKLQKCSCHRSEKIKPWVQIIDISLMDVNLVMLILI